ARRLAIWLSMCTYTPSARRRRHSTAISPLGRRVADASAEVQAARSSGWRMLESVEPTSSLGVALSTLWHEGLTNRITPSADTVAVRSDDRRTIAANRARWRPN